VSHGDRIKRRPSAEVAAPSPNYVLRGARARARARARALRRTCYTATPYTVSTASRFVLSLSFSTGLTPPSVRCLSMSASRASEERRAEGCEGPAAAAVGAVVVAAALVVAVASAEEDAKATVVAFFFFVAESRSFPTTLWASCCFLADGGGVRRRRRRAPPDSASYAFRQHFDPSSV
jgi:hypothetical protein